MAAGLTYVIKFELKASGLVGIEMYYSDSIMEAMG